ncbi:hypothetical protein OU994_17470 [Pseudoduganella sp. SL102]|nr:hypothetical protein [Pseudoduganella sp. SL102]WBS00113.1 hypothetical protein OU994_17470 [Pseudoduganella sp. SL102]
MSMNVPTQAPRLDSSASTAPTSATGGAKNVRAFAASVGAELARDVQ